MFKDFQRPSERKATSLGSGFIIKKDGIVVTNNHVIANAEDIIVELTKKEYAAKVSWCRSICRYCSFKN